MPTKKKEGPHWPSGIMPRKEGICLYNKSGFRTSRDFRYRLSFVFKIEENCTMQNLIYL